MLNLLTRFSIRLRLLLMLAPVLLGLLYFAAVGSLDRHTLAADMQRIESLTEVAVAVSNVMHQVQLERGMSAGYLASGGQDFRQQLGGQREATDQALETLAQALEQTGSLGTDILGDLNLARGILETRSAVRRDVTRLAGELDDTIAFYTSANTHFAAAISRIPRQSDNGSIANGLTSYANLIHAKELAGIERAMLAAVFEADFFTPAQFQRFQSLLAQQQTRLDAMRALMRGTQLERFERAMGHRAVEASDDMRRIALERGVDGGFDIRAADWFQQQTARIEQLHALETGLARSLTEEATALRQAAWSGLAGFVLLALTLVAISLVLGFLIGRSVIDPIRQALLALEDIADGDGDLRRRLTVTGRDEIAQLSTAFNRFTQKIESMVTQVKETAASIHMASNEIAAGNDDLAQRTQEQASSLEETASSMEEMTTTVRTTADNAREADQLASSTRDHAEKGGQVVAEAMQAMGQIRESSDKVTTIISVIEEIAFQTNLLALNAAVEAARAGNQGRGFAVVASEVRTLAQKSAQAAREIRELITDSASRVEVGSELVNATGDSLTEIVDAVKRVTTVVSEIATASEEQSSGIEQVNSAVSQMDEVTQQNASLVEEVTAASRSLQEQAAVLNDMVSAFRVSDESGRATKTERDVVSSPGTQTSLEGKPGRHIEAIDAASA
ncbi:methyl-accepting chemotaxis protein [Natronospira bacteriovora]|uniref:Methyl-accepting chemotaxis protein n=1 Tax=Natronospira bacteriovora TaxID=3069753 RepID=A0ABU0WBI7_9GAMM|nr:methyl-accepting chemotaxis protein [Natronospira sp. AB-CW4]MDQ2070825.1 methyl-accepting chemotaxis protein [Natronospira sp. AB-CW4]